MRELLQWASACEQERLLQARSHAQPALYDSRRRSQPSAWQDRARRSRLLRLPDLARGYSTTLKARRRDRTEPTSRRARHRRASAARALRVSSSCDCAPTARLERLFVCERRRGRPTPTSSPQCRCWGWRSWTGDMRRRSSRRWRARSRCNWPFPRSDRSSQAIVAPRIAPSATGRFMQSPCYMHCT